MEETSTTSEPKSVNLKLLIDTKGQRVLFAEAGKDFVDFLLSLLSLPIGSVIRLLSCNEMVGSFGKLYESFENLSDSYLQPNADKNTLLKPPSGVASTTLLALPDKASNVKALYACSNSYCNRKTATYNPQNSCTNCGSTMSAGMTIIEPQQGESSAANGYVKEVVTYMVMDDLELKPMSTITSIGLINKYNVKEFSALEEKEVSVGIEEGLKLLKALFESKTALTDVFLRKGSSIDISE
ncbi:hypothetical protein UlMin_025719 [Ulmus minor]